MLFFFFFPILIYISVPKLTVQGTIFSCLNCATTSGHLQCLINNIVRSWTQVGWGLGLFEWRKKLKEKFVSVFKQNHNQKSDLVYIALKSLSKDTKAYIYIIFNSPTFTPLGSTDAQPTAPGASSQWQGKHPVPSWAHKRVICKYLCSRTGIQSCSKLCWSCSQPLDRELRTRHLAIFLFSLGMSSPLLLSSPPR